MAINKKYLQSSAILGIVLSAFIFVIAIVYAFISNLSISWIILLVIIAMTEIIAFSASILLFFNPKKRIFAVGLVTLFAGLVPGIMILTFYFKTKRSLLRNFDLNS